MGDILCITMAQAFRAHVPGTYLRGTYGDSVSMTFRVGKRSVIVSVQEEAPAHPVRDRNGQPPLTRDELQAFRDANPMDGLAKVALAAWVNVSPDMLPDAMQAHNCPATMEAWSRVADAVRAAVLAEGKP